MTMRFWSKEWVEAGVQKANSDENYKNKNANLKAKTWVVITDCPDGNDVSVKFYFDKGKVLDYQYKTMPAPADFRVENSHWDESISLFRTQASYETWEKIQKREIDPLRAQGNAKVYSFDGDLMRMMLIKENIMTFSDIQVSVTYEY